MSLYFHPPPITIPVSKGSSIESMLYHPRPIPVDPHARYIYARQSQGSPIGAFPQVANQAPQYSTPQAVDTRGLVHVHRTPTAHCSVSNSYAHSHALPYITHQHLHPSIECSCTLHSGSATPNLQCQHYHHHYHHMHHYYPQQHPQLYSNRQNQDVPERVSNRMEKPPCAEREFEAIKHQDWLERENLRLREEVKRELRTEKLLRDKIRRELEVEMGLKGKACGVDSNIIAPHVQTDVRKESQNEVLLNQLDDVIMGRSPSHSVRSSLRNSFSRGAAATSRLNGSKRYDSEVLYPPSSPPSPSSSQSSRSSSSSSIEKLASETQSGLRLPSFLSTLPSSSDYIAKTHLPEIPSKQLRTVYNGFRTGFVPAQGPGMENAIDTGDKCSTKQGSRRHKLSNQSKSSESREAAGFTRTNDPLTPPRSGENIMSVSVKLNGPMPLAGSLSSTLESKVLTLEPCVLLSQKEEPVHMVCAPVSPNSIASGGWCAQNESPGFKEPDIARKTDVTEHVDKNDPVVNMRRTVDEVHSEAVSLEDCCRNNKAKTKGVSSEETNAESLVPGNGTAAITGTLSREEVKIVKEDLAKAETPSAAQVIATDVCGFDENQKTSNPKASALQDGVENLFPWSRNSSETVDARQTVVSDNPHAVVTTRIDAWVFEGGGDNDGACDGNEEPSFKKTAGPDDAKKDSWGDSTEQETAQCSWGANDGKGKDAGSWGNDNIKAAAEPGTWESGTDTQGVEKGSWDKPEGNNDINTNNRGSACSNNGDIPGKNATNHEPTEEWYTVEPALRQAITD